MNHQVIIPLTAAAAAACTAAAALTSFAPKFQFPTNQNRLASPMINRASLPTSVTSSLIEMSSEIYANRVQTSTPNIGAEAFKHKGNALVKACHYTTGRYHFDFLRFGGRRISHDSNNNSNKHTTTDLLEFVNSKLIPTKVIQNLLQATFNTTAYRLTEAQLVFACPGAIAQPYHADNYSSTGLTVTIPLVDVRNNNGYTEVLEDSSEIVEWCLGGGWPSEMKYSRLVALAIMLLVTGGIPKSVRRRENLEVGDVMSFDGKTLHRGEANSSREGVRPILVLRWDEGGDEAVNFRESGEGLSGFVAWFVGNFG